MNHPVPVGEVECLGDLSDQFRACPGVEYI
jgi:hypothetical protein